MFFRKKKFADSNIDFLVVGLGNPGAEYELTRHNCGFLAIDYIAEQLHAGMKKLKFKSLYDFVQLDGRRIMLVKPQTFMNLSGTAVRDIMEFYKLTPDRLIVISDDMTLDTGRLRIRRRGSDGGQKGMANIIELLGKDDFARIRIGIGKKPHPDFDAADWVLSRFKKDEIPLIQKALENSFSALRLIAAGNIDDAMSRFNGGEHEN